MLPISRIIAHREWAPGRKSDPVFDMDWARAGAAGIRPRTPTAAPAPRREDDLTVQIHLKFGDLAPDGTWTPNDSGRHFRGSATAEVGDDSSVVEAAWVRWDAHWGVAHWRIVFWGPTGPIGEVPDPDTRDNWPVPAGCRSFTVEGDRQDAGVTLAATLLQLPKR